MMETDFPLWLLLAAFSAGLVDAVVGGGGLIQIPALFSALSAQPPATLFGTNKLASVFGTLNAGWRYARRVQLPWPVVLPAALAAFVFSWLGAMIVAQLPPQNLRLLVLGLLVAVAVYSFRTHDLGLTHTPRHSGPAASYRALLAGSGIGFYDGFFGPGTGSFLIFIFVRGFGFDFLHASASAKLVNVATNLAALSFFVPHGYWLPLAGLLMALCNMAGSWIGAHLALRHGSRFVRRTFLGIVCLLIARFGWETWQVL